ncbi:hypothetical protein C0991_011553 [Blastosporella zonata]|nr:hypothetical protein C0991_011553 [Blastosporella zonata]
MVEEAIRNGTWLPPSPARFGFGPGGRRVDLSKKPKLWEAFVGEGEATQSVGRKVEMTTEWEWDSIRPVSAAYVVQPILGDVASARDSNPLPHLSLAGRVRGLFGPRRTTAALTADGPTVTETSPTAVTAAPLLDGTSVLAPAPIPQKVRVAVLIAMPQPSEMKSQLPVASTSLSHDQLNIPHLEVGVAELDMSLPQSKGKEVRVSVMSV